MRRTTRNDLRLRLRKPMLLLLSALFVAACSDDSGDVAGPINTGGVDGGAANRAPNASISADRTAVPASDNHSTVVILDG